LVFYARSELFTALRTEELFQDRFV